jgi:hypothetical protein
MDTASAVERDDHRRQAGWRRRRPQSPGSLIGMQIELALALMAAATAGAASATNAG